MLPVSRRALAGEQMELPTKALLNSFLLGQPVNIGCRNKLFIISADGIVVMIIAHDVNDIRSLLGKNNVAG